MIEFNSKKYELFFSNNLSPLIALNYADEQFFEEFKGLCGKKYRILSIIRKSWQNKYGLSDDIDKLKQLFELKIDDAGWADDLLVIYGRGSNELKLALDLIKSKDYSRVNDSELVDDIANIRKKSAVLDAMSNMLHLFSSLIGYKFFEHLHNYSDDKEKVNQNFIFYTQPIKESRFAKITMPVLKNKIALSEKDSNFSKILRIGAFVKDDVSELLDLRKELMKNLFKEISKRMKCGPDDLNYFQISEIKNFLLKKEYPKKLVEDRKKITILYYQSDTLKVFEGDNAEALLKKSNMHEINGNKSIKLLKGQTASLGKVIGIAVVAYNSEEALRKIKKGDILVAPYTAVEYVPAMKKAAAIITETGGITSHAAIVSRELGVACIIGVRDATKILKDGQKVEVNADEGIIRII